MRSPTRCSGWPPTPRCRSRNRPGRDRWTRSAGDDAACVV